MKHQRLKKIMLKIVKYVTILEMKSLIQRNLTINIVLIIKNENNDQKGKLVIENRFCNSAST